MLAQTLRLYPAVVLGFEFLQGRLEIRAFVVSFGKIHLSRNKALLNMDDISEETFLITNPDPHVKRYPKDFSIMS
jgi:hypothetical protein